VDSSVAAALLKKAGNDVFGIHMRLGSDRAQNLADLEHTCQILDIPFHQLDLEKEFQSLVIDYFCREYGLGRTPNPCIRCNQEIKFGFLFERALDMGADFLATGHYARIEKSANGYRLLKAIDRSRDQSYFLYTLGQSQLEHLLFPLGGLSKQKVRNFAGELGLPVSHRRDSQDICFIPDNDYRSFLSGRVPLKEGEIVDITGKLLGRHGGLALYTVGQRHKLGLNLNKQLYVLRLDAENNRLVVGSRDQLLSNHLTANSLSWVGGEVVKGPLSITAKVRYKAPEVGARLNPGNSRAEVSFTKPQSAVTPGQSVVFYQGEAVLGGGVIDAVLR
jgi:tRNA-specific 2-thiouridylase